MNEILPQLLCAHLIGDFLLQNDWMAKNKASSTWACMVHVAAYSIPMTVALTANGYFGLWVGLIGFLINVQHFLQDRFQLHLKWMKLYGQTPPDKWPVGPLCVDQAWHIAFLWLFSSML